MTALKIVTVLILVVLIGASIWFFNLLTKGRRIIKQEIREDEFYEISPERVKRNKWRLKNAHKVMAALVILILASIGGIVWLTYPIWNRWL